jgi:myo-inositol catabolism protein IolC
VTNAEPVFAIGLDHRVDFCREIVGSGERPGAAEREQAASLKLAVFDAVAQAVEDGLPKSSVVAWADPDLGEGALLRARAMSIAIAVSVDRPGDGTAGLSFDTTGDAWSLMSRLAAQYAGTRTNYNFASETSARENAQQQLRLLAGKCSEAGRKLIIELAPHATERQIADAGGADTAPLRAQLLIEGMRALQDAGVEPSVWVVAPPPDELIAATVAGQAHVDGRVGVSVLFEVGSEPDPGRLTPGPSRADRAVARLAARTPGVGGVVAGPDLYFSTLVRLHQGLIERADAVAEISTHLRKVWEIYAGARRASGVA